MALPKHDFLLFINSAGVANYDQVVLTKMVYLTGCMYKEIKFVFYNFWYSSNRSAKNQVKAVNSPCFRPS